MTITEIAALYLDGLKMRQQSQELSNPELAKKFERARRTIKNIAHGIPCNVPEWEKVLIRACISERDSMRAKSAQVSMAGLCYEHKVSHHSIINEIGRMEVDCVKGR